MQNRKFLTSTTECQAADERFDDQQNLVCRQNYRTFRPFTVEPTYFMRSAIIDVSGGIRLVVTLLRRDEFVSSELLFEFCGRWFAASASASTLQPRNFYPWPIRTKNWTLNWRKKLIAFHRFDEIDWIRHCQLVKRLTVTNRT